MTWRKVRSHAIAACAVGCALVAGTRTAHADLAIVVEENQGERPATHTVILAPLRRELEARGVLADPDHILTEARNVLPLPARTAPTITTAAIRSKLDSAQDKVAHAKFEQAVAEYDAALRLVDENPIAVVADDTAPDWLTRAYVGLAFAHQRLGHAQAATDAVAEQIWASRIAR